jgi:hypothetical protein
MTDKEFLLFIYNRLVYHYGEDMDTDFVLRLRRIIVNYPDDKPKRDPYLDQSLNQNPLHGDPYY